MGSVQLYLVMNRYPRIHHRQFHLMQIAKMGLPPLSHLQGHRLLGIATTIAAIPFHTTHAHLVTLMRHIPRELLTLPLINGLSGRED